MSAQISGTEGYEEAEQLFRRYESTPASENQGRRARPPSDLGQVMPQGFEARWRPACFERSLNGSCR